MSINDKKIEELYQAIISINDVKTCKDFFEDLYYNSPYQNSPYISSIAF